MSVNYPFFLLLRFSKGTKIERANLVLELRAQAPDSDSCATVSPYPTVLIPIPLLIARNHNGISS